MSSFKLVQSGKLVSLFPFPPPASPGRPGRPSRVVWCQSHAGKLDWRVHRLLLWFQTQGESQLPSPHFSLFIHSSLSFQSLNLFPPIVSLLLPLPGLCFHLFLPEHWLLASFWIPLFIYVFLLKIMHWNIEIFHFVVRVQRVHPSASGNLPKQMMSQISFCWVFQELYLQFLARLSFQPECLQKAHWKPHEHPY